MRVSSVGVKTVAVYLRMSTPLAQRQASTPVGLGQLLRYAFLALGSGYIHLYCTIASLLPTRHCLPLFNNTFFTL